ncbi:MAG: response regulator [Candidatus Goldbacteria bacterium]|nr:response regulator [Candidatus Goldiibacteriota bacterium]
MYDRRDVMDSGNKVNDKSILVVDDEYSIREALKMFFENKGYKVKLAVDGREALDIIEKEDCDLIISDIRMNRLNGMDLIKKVEEYSKKIPVIIITAYPELNTALDAIKYGVVDYIIKPFELKELEEKVRSAVFNKCVVTDEYCIRKIREDKIDFLSKYTHDLRTPLTSVSGWLKLLLMEEFGKFKPEQLEVLKNVEKNVKKMKLLIEDITMLYSIINCEEKIKIGEHNVTEIINSVINEENLENVQKQKIEIKIYDGLEKIVCDKDKIRRVLSHLIENAFRFSLPDTRISIIVRAFLYNNENYVKISVCDEGDKIKYANKRLLFRKFFDNNVLKEKSDADKKGLGLGLTLSKAIIEAHNGRIWLEYSDDMDKGNIFSFILPVKGNVNNNNVKNTDVSYN